MSETISLIIPYEVQVASLKIQMDYFAENEQYEFAAEWRDKIKELKENPKDRKIECKKYTISL